MTASTVSRYEIWYANDAGVRMALLSQVGAFDYVKVLNDVGNFSLSLPASFDLSLIRRDARIEFWRAYPGGKLYLDQIGLLRQAWYATQNGKTTFKVGGPDLNHLIKRRHVLYYEGAAQALAEAEYADDLCKRLVRENHGASATDTDRSMANAGLSVAANLSAAQQVSLAFHYQNVLNVCQDAAEASRQKGTSLYFGIVPLSPVLFEFRTKTSTWGHDRTIAGLQGLLSLDSGNLADPELDQDWQDEITHMTALGKGEGAAQQVRDAEDSARIGASVFGRIEGVTNASGADNSTAVTDAAQSGLEKNRGRRRFKGRLVATHGFVYGRDWGFGDLLAWRYLGFGGAGIVRSVRVSVDGNGKEIVEARLETEE